jgi:hypothetical protein
MASEWGIRVQVVITSVGGAESGGTTTGDKPLISGQGDPCATVDIHPSATLLGPVTANAEGNGSFQPATPLLDDVHDLSAIQASANGVTSVTNYFALAVEAAVARPAIDSDTSSPSFTSPLTDGEAAHKPPLFPVNHFRSRRCE